MPNAVQNVMTVKEFECAFEAYLDQCNQTIEKNKDKFPYMEIWRARWRSLGSNNILQCAVYDDRPKAVYSLQLTDEMTIKIINRTNLADEDTWPLKFSYLKQVIDHPDDYTNHPANLDWGWLTHVFG